MDPEISFDSSRKGRKIPKRSLAGFYRSFEIGNREIGTEGWRDSNGVVDMVIATLREVMAVLKHSMRLTLAIGEAHDIRWELNDSSCWHCKMERIWPFVRLFFIVLQLL